MVIKQQRVLLLVPPHPQAFRQISQTSNIYPIIYITAWDGLDCVERRVTEKHHTQDHNTMTRQLLIPKQLILSSRLTISHFDFQAEQHAGGSFTSNYNNTLSVLLNS